MSNVAHGRVLVSQNDTVISWSVVEVSRSSRMVFIFYGGCAHVFTETYGWGNRGQCLDKCTGWVGRTPLGGHETRPKPKPNVDYYLVTDYYYFFLSPPAQSL